MDKQLKDYSGHSIKELIDERRELSHEWAEIKYQIEHSSAAYHEDDVQGDRYEYAENQRDLRALESDIKYLTELIDWLKFQHEVAEQDIEQSITHNFEIPEA